MMATEAIGYWAASLPAELPAPLAWLTIGSIVLGAVAAMAESARRAWRSRRKLRRTPRPGAVIPHGDWVCGDPELAAVLRAGLCEFRRALREANTPLPSVDIAYVTHGRLVLHLEQPTPVPPGTPWQHEPGPAPGRSWVLDTADAPSTAQDEQPFPTLTVIGVSHGWTVLIDLARAPGPVSIIGDAHQASRVLNALAFRLATSPWCGDVSIAAAGFESEITTPERDRIEHLPSPADGVALAERFAQRARDHSAALAAEGKRAIAGPLVVLFSQPPTGDDAARLARVAGDPATPVVTVCRGHTGTPGWTFEATADFRLRLDPFRVHVDPLVVDIEDVQRHVRAAIGHPDRLPAATAAAHERSRRSRQQHAESPGAKAPRRRGTHHTRQTPSESGQRVHYDAIRAMTAPALTDDARNQLWPALVEVRALGSLDVSTADGAVTGRDRELLTDLAVTIALRPGGLPRARSDELLAHSGASSDVYRQLEDWLGRDGDGTARLSEQDGIWRLSPSVRTDWALFRELVSTASPANERARLDSALALIRGELFGGPRTRVSTDPDLNRKRDQIRSLVIHTVRRCADLASSTGDTAGVVWALRRGLAGLPRAEALWRALLLFLWEHDRAALGPATDEMLTTLTAHHGHARLEPETASLLSRLGKEPNTWLPYDWTINARGRAHPSGTSYPHAARPPRPQDGAAGAGGEMPASNR